MNSTIENNLQKAVNAPSGHNTQAWKFYVTENSITIFPDKKGHRSFRRPLKQVVVNA